MTILERSRRGEHVGMSISPLIEKEAAGVFHQRGTTLPPERRKKRLLWGSERKRGRRPVLLEKLSIFFEFVRGRGEDSGAVMKGLLLSSRVREGTKVGPRSKA